MDEIAVNSGALTLRPRARIVHTLGDELISSETVALIELVKNSYDADASHVLIKFEGPLDVPGEGSISVMDNGSGMDFPTIRSCWMEPATAAKKRAQPTRRGRTVLGEKGIGRFAASRLAQNLEVVSRAIGKKSEIRVLFDWQQFDDERYLDEVLVLWEEGPVVEFVPNGQMQQVIQAKDTNEEAFTHGTSLIMTGLRVPWEREKLLELRTGLSRLISPFLSLPDIDNANNFRIFLELPEPFKDLVGPVDPPEALNKPHYSLRGSVDNIGSYKFVIHIPRSTEISVSAIFHLKDERLPSCGAFDLELRVWDREASDLEDIATNSNSTIQDVRRDLDAAAGINIYRDGFRVLPYGEPRNDWLRLDLRRVQNPTMRISNNQVVGYVQISNRNNPLLRDQSNREGIIDGQAFSDLGELVKHSLALLEGARYEFRHPKANPSETRSQLRGGMFSGFNLERIDIMVRRNYAGDAELLNLVQEIGKDLERRITEVQEVLSRYRRLSTLGQLIDTVLHDGRTPLTKIGNVSLLCLNELDNSPCEEPTNQMLRSNLESIISQSHAVATVFRKIAPFGGRKRGKPKEVNLEAIIAQAFSVLETEIRECGVKISLPDSSTIVTVDEAEIQQVILNLLDNSLYWLRHVPRPRRQIAVRVRRLPSQQVEVTFSDSGPGVPVEIHERIFEPYFSSKEDGVGLGLAISGEIITDYYGGRLELADSGSLPGATFRITLSRRV